MNATRLLIVAALLAMTGMGLPAQSPTPAPIKEPLPTPPAPVAGTPTDILVSGPSGAYPPGTYGSPWCGEHGCSGPFGRDGALTYEVYAVTGVSMPVGGSELSAALKVGWTTGGGARTLWFNADSTAAWVFDLGLTYTQNEGQQDRTLNVATPRTSPIVQDPFTGITTGGERIFPDGLADYRPRKMARTNFNFAVGRDWWLRGPGTLQTEQGPNFRVGSDIGGRWGTSHIDLVPLADPENYLKRTGVTHSVFIGMHMGWEKPVGAWILFGGLRAEWGYTMTNIVPPLGGDIHDINILMTLGARF